MYHFSPSLFSSTKKQKTKWKKLLITTLIYNPPSSTNNIQTLEYQQKIHNTLEAPKQSLLIISMAELENPIVMNKIITFLSSLVQRVAESNDLNSQFQIQKVSVFHGLTRPTISIQSYLERIFKYANCSPSCLIVAYVYLDRFTQKQPSLPINSFNVHRLLITSVMVAAKFMDDM